jgi:hypothetical protein
MRKSWLMVLPMLSSTVVKLSLMGCQQGRDLRYDGVGATCWGFSDLCHHGNVQIEESKKQWRKNGCKMRPRVYLASLIVVIRRELGIASRLSRHQPPNTNTPHEHGPTKMLLSPVEKRPEKFQRPSSPRIPVDRKKHAQRRCDQGRFCTCSPNQPTQKLSIIVAPRKGDRWRIDMGCFLSNFHNLP